MISPRFGGSAWGAAAMLGLTLGLAAPAAADEPLMRDFIGLNGHTVQFDADTYRPVATLVRDYHDFVWDVGDDTDFVTQFPFARNGVNWDTLYGDWVSEGFRINVAVQFHGTEDAEWVDVAADAKRYGRAFATHFGPSVGNALVNSIQIGNEPGHMSDAVYKEVFRNMAEGIREVDPNLTIVTPNITLGPSHQYAKSVTLWSDMLDLVDVFAVHSYPYVEQWPTWERSHPEDPAIDFLRDVQGIVDWRDQTASGKQVWVTEFGYDASSQEPDPGGELRDWVDVTDQQQAQYLTRSFLAFSEMDVDRAYMFWFNDSDRPGPHGSSGLTRDGVPKPSYWAMRHLSQTLGDYRFLSAVRENEDGLYIYAYQHEDDPSDLIWAIWLATGAGGSAQATLDDLVGIPLWADRMPLADGPADLVDFELLGSRQISLNVGESPTYLRLHVPEPGAAAIAGLTGLCCLLRRTRRR